MMQFGKAYAQAVIKNSQSLAKALAEGEVKVRGAAFGYTKSHQVLLDYDSGRLGFYSAKLEQANIIIDNGGRIGTSELTRLGYDTSDMEEVAELVCLAVLGKKPVDFIKKRVKSLVKQHQEPKYILKTIPRILE